MSTSLTNTHNREKITTVCRIGLDVLGAAILLLCIRKIRHRGWGSSLVLGISAYLVQDAWEGADAFRADESRETEPEGELSGPQLPYGPAS